MRNHAGPWVMADLEMGMYTGDDFLDLNTVPTMGHEYVTAMLKGRTCNFALKGGDAQSGRLTSLYLLRVISHKTCTILR